ncbi:MAG: ABC transporter permease [Lachnospiraceae bacterium]|nr:ABC transporter permease [Lachnospiraceae bacterium]
MKSIKAKQIISEYSSWLALLALILVSAGMNRGDFLSFTNISNLLRQISMLGISAIGVNFIVIAGCKDLSVGGMAAVCSMIAAHLSGFGLPVVLFGGLLAAFAMGCLNGVLVAKLKIMPFIATLGTMIAYKGIALLLNDSKSLAAQDGDGPFGFLGKGIVLGIPFPVIVFALIAVCGILVSKHTRYGRAVYAIGGNEESAVMMGIPVERIKMILYIVSGLLSGLGGIMIASRLNAGIPTTGDSWDMYTIAAVVMGGTMIRGGEGKISGAVAGVLIWGVIQNMINMMGDVSSYWQQIIMGLILLAAVIIQNTVESK